MSTAARRRLMRDFKKLQDDPPNEGICCTKLSHLNRGNSRTSRGQHHVLAGSNFRVLFFFSVFDSLRPDDTAWEGGTFQLTLAFSEEYPNKAPKVKFITKMFHPNSTKLPKLNHFSSIYWWINLPGHFIKSMVTYLWYFCDFDVYLIATMRSKS